jgi:hypothetical protein
MKTFDSSEAQFMNIGEIKLYLWLYVKRKNIEFVKEMLKNGEFL